MKLRLDRGPEQDLLEPFSQAGRRNCAAQTIFETLCYLQALLVFRQHSLIIHEPDIPVEILLHAIRPDPQRTISPCNVRCTARQRSSIINGAN